MKESEPVLKDFFKLYIVAQPSKHNNQIINHIKKIMLFICYLLFSLNNTKIISFKFDLTYYLNSAETSNEGLNIITNLKMTITSRMIN